MKMIDLFPEHADCILDADYPSFSLKEQGTNHSVVVEVGQRKCEKIHIDEDRKKTPPQQALFEGVRCDWCIRDYENGECLFVELKGSDIEHAIQQIACSMDWFKNHVENFHSYKEFYIILRKNSHCPEISSFGQKLLLSIRRKHHSEVKKGHFPKIIFAQ